MKYFLLSFLLSCTSLAGLPPTTSKISTDANDVTTFKFRFPNFTGTHTGTTLSLGVNSIAGGGTGQTTKSSAFDALSPMTTGGDIVYGGASGTGTRLANGSSGQVLTSAGGTAAPTWATPASSNTFSAVENLGFSTSVASNALSIMIKDSLGNDPSGATRVAFRSSTQSSGSYTVRIISSALSITVSSGSTLGASNGIAKNIWLYAIDNAGTVELAVSGLLLDESILYTTTAEGGAGAADSGSVLYSATARTNVPIRLIGRLLSLQTTAGTWAVIPYDSAPMNKALVGVLLVPGTGRVESFSGTFGTGNGTTSCTANPCSYLDQIGSAVDSVGRNSTGSYNINTVRTYSKLKCTASAFSSTAGAFTSAASMGCGDCNQLTFSTGSVGDSRDSFVTFICMGAF
jgi:hypothetical protein